MRLYGLIILPQITDSPVETDCRHRYCREWDGDEGEGRSGGMEVGGAGRYKESIVVPRESACSDGHTARALCGWY